MYPCLKQRLDVVRSAVETGGSREQVANAISGVQIDFTGYDSLAIQSAFASDVAAHIPQDRLYDYIQAYQMIPEMDRTSALEAAGIAKLRSLSRTGPPLTQEEKSRGPEATETLRNANDMMFIGARWTLPTMRQLGGALDPVPKQRYLNFARHYYGACIKDIPSNWAPQSPFHPNNYHPGRPFSPVGLGSNVSFPRPKGDIRINGKLRRDKLSDDAEELDIGWDSLATGFHLSTVPNKLETLVKLLLG